jgi:hypothetical protein
MPDERRKGLPRRSGELAAMSGNGRDRRGNDPLLRVLVVVLAVVATACGEDGTGPPKTSGTPGSPEPTATPVVLSESFSSSVYGYSLQHPVGWSVTEATRSLSENELPEPGTQGADTFVSPGGRPELSVGAKRATRGLTLGKLTGAAERLVEAATHCESGGRERSRLGGEPARLFVYQGCVGFDLQWATVIHGKRAFLILWRNDSGTWEADRPVFERILATLDFGS